MSETVACPLCDSEISATAKKCRYCGEWVSRGCEGCGTPIRGEWAARGRCAECQARQAGPHPAPAHGAPLAMGHKSRGTAAFLALVLGGLGAHKFYLDKPGMGVLYLLFFWTFIPVLVGLVEGIQYMTMTDEAFEWKYGGRGER